MKRPLKKSDKIKKRKSHFYYKDVIIHFNFTTYNNEKLTIY